jgi:hypothetical protein
VIPTLGQIICDSSSSDILGITDRRRVLRYIARAIELGVNEANWDINLGTIDVCADCDGLVTLPWFVGTVLAVNAGGQPTWFRNSWYEFHINGLGSANRGCGNQCGWGWLNTSDDMLWSPVLQDLKQWSCVAAICEDSIDGSQNPPLNLIVQGETMDSHGNQKMAITIPATGPSMAGVFVPLLNNYAATDPAATMFKRITQISKPVTRGYVKLIGFPPTQNGNGVTLGYYGPNETQPRYRRIRVANKCPWVRVRYRRAEVPLVDDYEILPIASTQAMLDLIRVVKLRETNNGDEADKMLARVVNLLGKIEAITEGPGIAPLQVDSFGSALIDFR